MTTLPELSRDFSPKDQNAGENLYRQGAVHLRTLSDTKVDALLRQGSGYRVALELPTPESVFIRATCSCTRGQHGRPCAHVFATLLGVNLKQPELLAGANQISFTSVERAPNPFAERAKALRKAQNEKRKSSAREQRLKERGHTLVTYPDDVRAALLYFKENGFDLEPDPSEAALSEAKKKLARIFHPDRGGTHEEILILNANFDIIRTYLV